MSELNCGGSIGSTKESMVGGAIGSKPDRTRKENNMSSRVMNAHMKGRFCTLHTPSFPPVSDASQAHLRQIPPGESLCHGTLTLCSVGSLHNTKNPNNNHTDRICTIGKSFCSRVFGFCTAGKVAVDVELNKEDPPGEGGPDCCIRAFRKSILGSPFVFWLNAEAADGGRAKLGFPTAAPMPRAHMNSACWFSDHTDGSTGEGGSDCRFGGGFGRGNSGGSSPINVATVG